MQLLKSQTILSLYRYVAFEPLHFYRHNCVTILLPAWAYYTCSLTDSLFTILCNYLKSFCVPILLKYKNFQLIITISSGHLQTAQQDNIKI